MSVAENKEIARKFINDCISDDNWDIAPEVLSEDLVIYHPSVPGGKLAGRDAVVQVFQAYRAGFPDMKITIEDEIAEDNKVVVQWRALGTQTGDLFGIPPTGKSVNVPAVSILRISDGKIVEDHISEDTMGMMKQLGVIPE
ncbi:MAG TPA: ester cyclase [Actinomycetota bacterium]|nr:ester cyclase [Actinomycetota bacterium]